MAELEKYGLLSVASVLVLFLILTFAGPRVDGGTLVHPLAAQAARAEPPEPVQASRAGPAKGPDQAASSRPRPERAADPPPASNGAGGPRTHEIRSGDTLMKIAERYLGDARRWPEIAAVNGRLDPRQLQVGQRIAIPPAAAAGGARKADPGRVASATAEVARGEPAAPGKKKVAPKPSASSHRVQGGDTLSGIALRYYGDATRWRAVYDANKQRIPRKDRLEVGTILVLP